MPALRDMLDFNDDEQTPPAYGRKRKRSTDKKPKLKGSQTGLQVVNLQNTLPNARVVYCSATGVSE